MCMLQKMLNCSSYVGAILFSQNYSIYFFLIFVSFMMEWVWGFWGLGLGFLGWGWGLGPVVWCFPVIWGRGSLCKHRRITWEKTLLYWHFVPKGLNRCMTLNHLMFHCKLNNNKFNNRGLFLLSLCVSRTWRFTNCLGVVLSCTLNLAREDNSWNTTKHFLEAPLIIEDNSCKCVGFS